MGGDYAELHCHSNFSFLDGASHPEELAEEATRLGLAALAITDHDGFYGVVRFAEAARAVDLPTVFGAELTLLAGSHSLRAGIPGPRALAASASSLRCASLTAPHFPSRKSNPTFMAPVWSWVASVTNASRQSSRLNVWVSMPVRSTFPLDTRSR